MVYLALDRKYTSNKSCITTTLFQVVRASSCWSSEELHPIHGIALYTLPLWLLQVMHLRVSRKRVHPLLRRRGKAANTRLKQAREARWDVRARSEHLRCGSGLGANGTLCAPHGLSARSNLQELNAESNSCQELDVDQAVSIELPA
jgi:hypothetical protein